MLFFIPRQLGSKIKFYRDKEVLIPLNLGVRVPYSRQILVLKRIEVGAD